MFSESEYAQFLADERGREKVQKGGSNTDINNNYCTSFRKRLLSRDCKKFRKFAETTNTHGVRQIFIGKSLIRKIFWGLFFLFSLTFCLVNISRSIQFYISVPTATTVTSRHVPSIQFPAVTVCNLHLFRSSYLDALNLTDLTRATLNLKISNPDRLGKNFRTSVWHSRDLLTPVLHLKRQYWKEGRDWRSL